MQRDSFNMRYNTKVSGKKVGAYLASWGIYGRSYQPADVPVESMTHLYLAFAGLCGNNPGAYENGSALRATCQASSYSDTSITKGAKTTYEAEFDDTFAWLGKSYEGDKWDQPYKGILGQIRHLKQRNPDLKVILSIGGWSYTRPFLEMTGNSAALAKFVASVKKLLMTPEFQSVTVAVDGKTVTLPLFDGIDVDYEFPGGGGLDADLDASPLRAQDGVFFVKMIKDLRTMLDEVQAARADKARLELSTAIGTGPSKLAAVNFAEVAKYVDMINLMSYDFHGSWSKVGHNTAVRQPNPPLPGDEGLSVLEIVDTLVNKQRVPSTKIAVGVAMYGRVWQGESLKLADPTKAVGMSASVPPVKTVEDGVLSYFDLWRRFVGSTGSGVNGFTTAYDTAYGQSIAANRTLGQWITYESPKSVAEKGEIVKRMNLGGLFAWEIDDDNGLLLNSMNESLGNTRK